MVLCIYSIYLNEILQGDSSSTFTRATLYTGPRNVSGPARPLASVLQRVQYWSKARRKSLVKPLFSTCNVMYLMLQVWSRNRPLFCPEKGMGEARAHTPRVPSKKFYNFIVPLLLFSEKYDKMDKKEA